MLQSVHRADCLVRAFEHLKNMGAYDEVEIEDMTWNEELQAYTYSCPCGDVFQITLVRLHRRQLSCR